MSNQYICELCSKEFKQKIDYTRHKNKKNACVTADKLRQVVEKKNEQNISHDTTVKNMSTLFSSCMNILRDNESLTGDKALRNLSYLLVLKLIEPMIGNEIDLENFDYSLPEQYKSKKHLFLQYTLFSKIASSKEDDIPKLLKNIWDYILSKHPKTKDIFITGKSFDMKKQATFRKLIDKLYEFDLSDVDVDIQGHAYEDLLKDIMTGKVLGQFFTQPLVKDMMVDLINPKLNDDGTCETIFDPAMGTGGFLMTYLRHLQKQAEHRKINIDWGFISSTGVGGQETEPDTFQLCKTNMLVSCGHMLDNLQQGDSIRDPIRGKYDIVLANPPFGIKGLEYQDIKNEDGVRDKYLPIESKSAVPLFLQAIIGILKVGGRCAMVMPDGQELFGKGKALVAIREYLMKTCDLKEVHYLPSGVFTNTTIKTCVLYFHKRQEGSDVIEIGGKKTRTYKFKTPLQTKSVKFYDYNPYEKVKNLLIEVDASKIAENNYSLNYAEYLQSEEQGEQDEKEHNSEVEWKTLGELFDIEKGSLQSSKNKEGDFTFITASDNNKTHMTYTHDCEAVMLVGGAEGSIGKCHYYKGKFIASDLLFIMTAKNINEIHYRYIYYILNNMRDVIVNDRNIVRGSAKKAISLQRCKNIQIPLPSLQNQQRIVERLDYLYETCIETSTNAIEQLKAKKGMIVEMMTTGVESKPLGEVCEFKNGQNITKEKLIDGEFPVVGGGQKPLGYHNNYNVLENTILISKDGAYAGFISMYNTKVFASNHCIYVSCVCDSVISKFLYYYLKVQLQDHLYKLQIGVAQPGIKKEEISKLKIPIPSLHTQKTLLEQCERIDRLMTDLEADRENSKELAQNYLNSFIKSEEDTQEDTQEVIQEDTQEYANIIISEESDEESH
jgi:type I restriction-modification system DNA methylase subunit